MSTEFRNFTPDELRRNFKRAMVPVTTKNAAVYRNVLSKQGLMTNIPGCATVYEAFDNGLKSAGADSKCLGHRPLLCKRDLKTGQPIWGPWTWQTRQEVSERRLDFGSGLLNIRGQSLLDTQWTFGIYATNRPTWVIADHAGYAFSLIPVALFDTLGPESVEYIINHAELQVMVCSADKILNVLKVAHKCPSLKAIVSMDPLDESIGSLPGLQNFAISGMGASASQVLRYWAEEKGIKLYSFEEVEKIGKFNRVPVRPPRPEDIATICYTSGTTGNPKGAVTTHANFAAVAAGLTAVGIRFDPSDLHISYLPLAHSYERVSMMGMMNFGVSVAFYRGDISLLFEDIGDVKPTVFISVPRLLNRIHSAILQKTLHSGSSITAALFTRGLEAKISGLANGDLTHAFWDRVMFNKIKNVLGGRVRMIISGSAPISGDVLNALRCYFSCEVLEGFGQTETAAIASVNWIGNYKAGGSIGAIIPTTELKLVDILDMKYLSTDLPNPRGEIVVRGANIMRGYHKEPQKTAETIDADGWLYTGDVGTIDARGLLRIIDRKKHIFKLSQGEYVAPEKLENIFTDSGFVAQIFIHGDSIENELVCVIVPEPEFSVQQAIAHKILPKNTLKPGPILPGKPLPQVLAVLANDAAFKKLVYNDLVALGKSAKLAGFEFPKAVYLEGVNLMSVDSGLLTLKRDVARDYYSVQIKQMYAEIRAAKASSSAADAIGIAAKL